MCKCVPPFFRQRRFRVGCTAPARPLPLWLSGFSSDTCAASVTGRRRPSTLESADNPLRCLSRLCSGAASDAEGGDGNELGLEFEMAKSGGGECGD